MKSVAHEAPPNVPVSEKSITPFLSDDPMRGEAQKTVTVEKTPVPQTFLSPSLDPFPCDKWLLPSLS